MEIAHKQQKRNGKALYPLPANGILKATKEATTRDLLELADIQMALKNMNGAFGEVSTKGNLHYSFDVNYNEPYQVARLGLRVQIKNLSFELEPFSEVFDNKKILGASTEVPKYIYLYYFKKRLKEMNKSIKQLNKFISCGVTLESRIPDELSELIKSNLINSDNMVSLAAALTDIKHFTLSDKQRLYFDVFCEPQWGLIHLKIKMCIRGLRGQIILLNEQIYAYDDFKTLKFGRVERTLREWNRRFR